MKELTAASQTSYLLTDSLDPSDINETFWQTTQALSLATASKLAFPFSVVLGAIGVKQNNHYASISALFISGTIQYASIFSLSSALESQQDEANDFRAALIACQETSPLINLDRLDRCTDRVFGHLQPEKEEALAACFTENAPK